MEFIKEHLSKEPIVDTVFAIVNQAKAAKKELGEEAVVDATIGSLYSEEGNLVTLDSVFSILKNLDDAKLAAYASSFTGNPDFKEAVKTWMAIPENLYCEVIATPGGTGAVDISISSTLDEGETLIVPEIAWTSYALMARMNNLKLASYSLFEGDHFNLASFKKTIEEVAQKQQRITIVLNDPCHNPTGYSLSMEEWKEIIAFLNEVGKEHPVILVNDVAYIDYSYNGPKAKDYIKLFENLSANVAVIICFSLSKSLTSYGLRCGAAIVCSTSQDSVDQFRIIFEKQARAIWSNINNGAMNTFVELSNNHKDEYEAEKEGYVKLLKERSDLFKKEADEAGLAYYPYKEGFFITLAMDNETRDRLHQALLDEHIYSVKVNKGIRVAVCSLPTVKIKGLAKRIKEIEQAL